MRTLSHVCWSYPFPSLTASPNPPPPTSSFSPLHIPTTIKSNLCWPMASGVLVLGPILNHDSYHSIKENLCTSPRSYLMPIGLHLGLDFMSSNSPSCKDFVWLEITWVLSMLSQLQLVVCAFLCSENSLCLILSTTSDTYINHHQFQEYTSLVRVEIHWSMGVALSH